MPLELGGLFLGESREFRVPILGDNKVELDETFLVELLGFDNLGRNVSVVKPTGIGTIRNDDSADLTVSDVTLREGDDSTTAFVFEVSLDQQVDVPLILDLNLVPETATPLEDFLPATLSTVVGGEFGQSGTVVVTVLGDTTVELDETFLIELFDFDNQGRNIQVTKGVGQGMIENDDSASLSISDVTVSEGPSGGTEALFQISLDAPVDLPIFADFGTVDGTARVDDSDYQAVSGNVSLGGELGQSTEVLVTVNGDNKVELDETFFVDLLSVDSAGRDVSVEKDRGVGTILNDDSATLSIGDASVVEGDDGPTLLVFDVTLSAPVDVPIVPAITLVEGGASFDDFDLDSLFVNLDGEQLDAVGVPVNGDETVELDEDFFVELGAVESLGRNVTIGKAVGVGTIENDDQATLSISSVSVPEGNDGTTPAVFAISLDAAVDHPVEVEFGTEDGSASGGDDYEPTFGTLHFEGAAETILVEVPVFGDTAFEADEEFLVNLLGLSAAGRNVVITPDSGVGTILNDDAPPLPVVPVEEVVYFNKDAEAERDLLPDGSGQRSIIRGIQITFAGPVSVPLGPISDDSFIVESTSLATAGTRVGLEVLSSELVAGKQVVVLGFTGTTLIEDISEDPARDNEMLENGLYRLTVDGGKLGIDANGVQEGTEERDDFFRRFGDTNGDMVLGRREYVQLRNALIANVDVAVFDFNDNDKTDTEDFLNFRRLFRDRLI